MVAFIESLLRQKLELPPSLKLSIERAHRLVATPPPKDAPPRSVVVKFLSYRCKEEIIKILKQRKKYAKAKKVLRHKKIRFQTPFPARLRVFYDGGTCTYDSAEEATKDMAEGGYQVKVVEPTEDVMEKIKHLTWRPRPSRERRTTGRCWTRV